MTPALVCHGPMALTSRIMRDSGLKRAFLIGLALIFSQAAPAEEIKAPRIVPATVDWNAAAAGLPGAARQNPAEAFAKLNAASQLRFPGIALSTVPVLLPFDTEGWDNKLSDSHADATPASAEPNADTFMQAGFQSSHFFLFGPSGYDSGFALRTSEIQDLADIKFTDPVYVLFSGFRMLYEPDGPALPQGEPVKNLQDSFPGIRRIFHEFYVRYSFERYGVTYVAAIYCRDTRPRAKVLSCKQAERVAERFLRALKLAGGTPEAAEPPALPVPLDRPEQVSPAFTYFSPGLLIPGSGLKKDTDGRTDYTAYARLRFPLKDAPDFANSQSFANWGDCDFTGRSPRRLRTKGTPYSCKVNGLPLTFDEAAGGNYSYPWRDNFCEHRHFFVGQCPGGEGHQGQDIRPGFCKQAVGGDRCLPYQHDVVAAHDGVILRARKQEAVYLFINSPRAHLRVRYMHMNPKRLDADGILNGRQVREGDVIGQVGNYNDRERGTTYHLHFDIQVPTKAGWVFVNPYMTLVAAYEHLLGARGTEITKDDAAPPIAAVPPVIAQPSPDSSEAAAHAHVKHHGARAKSKPRRQARKKRRHAAH